MGWMAHLLTAFCLLIARCGNMHGGRTWRLGTTYAPRARPVPSAHDIDGKPFGRRPMDNGPAVYTTGGPVHAEDFVQLPGVFRVGSLPPLSVHNPSVGPADHVREVSAITVPHLGRVVYPPCTPRDTTPNHK